MEDPREVTKTMTMGDASPETERIDDCMSIDSQSTTNCPVLKYLWTTHRRP